jgi:hypothetical protein
VWQTRVTGSIPGRHGVDRRDPLRARPLKEIPLGELEREFSNRLSRLVGRRYVATVLRLHLEAEVANQDQALEIDFRVRPELRGER